MRRFTQEELLIGGEPEIVDCLLQAVRYAVLYRAKKKNCALSSSYRGNLMHKLEQSHALLLLKGVDIISVPRPGTSGDVRRQEVATDIRQRIVERLLEMNRG